MTLLLKISFLIRLVLLLNFNWQIILFVEQPVLFKHCTPTLVILNLFSLTYIGLFFCQKLCLHIRNSFLILFLHRIDP